MLGSTAHAVNPASVLSGASGRQPTRKEAGEGALLWCPPPTPAPSTSAPPSVGASFARPQEHCGSPKAVRVLNVIDGPLADSRLPAG
eukprot:3826782-Alexandrium_andersonii.AAC.1